MGPGAAGTGRVAGSGDLQPGVLHLLARRPTTLIEGKSLFFRGPPAAVEALKAMNVRAVRLANNHALDFSQEAFEDTLELLRAADIAVAGAGFGRDAAAPSRSCRPTGSGWG
jgi:poly-gamma-glutamate capsule biosynthesis protein CapA/YwtB (metallophosphatase superfamily)